MLGGVGNQPSEILSSLVDSDSPQEARSFLGYGVSELFFSAENNRWELHSQLRSPHTLVAVKEGSAEYPFGAQKWHFTQPSSCRDGPPGPLQNISDQRTLNLHLAVPNYGRFCCDSGDCIDSRLVCDDVDNCPGGEDEEDCRIVQFQDENYRKDRPPVEVILQNNTKVRVRVPLQINCSLTVIDFVNIDDYNGLFSIMFRWNVSIIETENKNIISA